jgi:spore coat protein U-like protein
MKRIILAVACLASISIPPHALARQRRSVPMTADISSATVSATAVAFGTVVPGESATGTGAISVTATEGIIYRIGLDSGRNRAGSTRSMRALNAPSAAIPYYLYADPGLKVPWGDNGLTNQDMQVTGSGKGPGQPDTITVYGSMKTERTSPVGIYGDTVMITVTY